jgi:hypothetical protein
MNKFSKYVLINLCVAGIIGFLSTSPRPKYRFSGVSHTDLGVALLLLSLPMLLIGFILIIIAKDKTYGSSLLATSGLLMLLSFGVCTIGNPPPY